MSRSKTGRASLAAGALVAGVLGGSMQAGAAPITVVNPSFETAISPAWSAGYQEGTRNYGTFTTIAPIDGTHELGFNNNYSVSRATQTTGYAVASAGEVITLTVGVGNYSFPWQAGSGGGMKAARYQGTINIMVGGVDVATNTAGNPNAFTPTAPVSSFADATLSYTTTAADIGQFVGIDFNIGSAPPSGAYFDNVRLDVASVPEPATGLMVMGMAGTLLAGRRRRSQQ